MTRQSETDGSLVAGDPSTSVARTSRWRQCWESDVYRLCGRSEPSDLLRLLLTSRTYRPVFTARLCQLYGGGGPLGAARHRVFRRLHRRTTRHAAMDFPWEASMGAGLALVHGWGLVVSPDAVIGRNVTIFHGVTIGRKDDIDASGIRTVGGAPRIGDGVWIGPNAIIVGPIEIGAGSRIGGGAVVAKDVPPASLVTGNPGRVVREGIAPDTPNAISADFLPIPADTGSSPVANK